VRVGHVSGVGTSMWQKICKLFASGKTVNVPRHFILLKFPSTPGCFVIISQFVNIKRNKMQDIFSVLIVFL
jgi:hypothetical protein